MIVKNIVVAAPREITGTDIKLLAKAHWEKYFFNRVSLPGKSTILLWISLVLVLAMIPFLVSAAQNTRYNSTLIKQSLTAVVVEGNLETLAFRDGSIRLFQDNEEVATVRSVPLPGSSNAINNGSVVMVLFLVTAVLVTIVRFWYISIKNTYIERCVGRWEAGYRELPDENSIISYLDGISRVKKES